MGIIELETLLRHAVMSAPDDQLREMHDQIYDAIAPVMNRIFDERGDDRDVRVLNILLDLASVTWMRMSAATQ